MDQLTTEGKKCKSEVCLICENPTAAECDAGSGDFVDCEKCGLSIHKTCFKLSGDLLKIFQDFERRNEKFPFTILCPGCRQFDHESIDVQVVDSCEEGDNSKNPFEIDCIVNAIVDHLNVQDLANVRLVNKLWNQNACRILSKESRQVQISPYNVIRRFLALTNLEKCLQIVKRSDQTKLMQKWVFELNTPQELKLTNQITTITKPTSVRIFKHTTLELELLEENSLFSAFLTNLSENVVDLSLDLQKIIGFDPTQFCMPKFSKLKSIKVRNLLRENYEFVKMIIENSPKLMNLALLCENYSFDDDNNLTLDDFVNEKSTLCLLTQKSSQNLQILKMKPTEFNFETTAFEETKLQTLSLHAQNPQNLKFGKLKSFLTSQNATLEKLKVLFLVLNFHKLEIIEEGEEPKQMDLPRLDKVLHFGLEFYFDQYDTLCNTDEEIWPIKPIHLAGKLPNLKKISLIYCQSWACSFEAGQKCPGVTELVLTNWIDGDMTKLVELFPQVKILNLKKFCYNIPIFDEKICPLLRNLDGWAESLKRIEISCENSQLENLDFEKLVCLSNLESIKMSKINFWGLDTNRHFIYPDFTPLFKIATLSQVAIKYFKISKDIVEDLREKYPSLDYSFYPK